MRVKVAVPATVSAPAPLIMPGKERGEACVTVRVAPDGIAIVADVLVPVNDPIEIEALGFKAPFTVTGPDKLPAGAKVPPKLIVVSPG